MVPSERIRSGRGLMHIIHISSELAPIAKAGGLGDVVYGLAKELGRQGHTVQILIPKYDCIHYGLLKNLKIHYQDLWSYDGPYRYHNTIWSAEVDGLSILLLEPHHPEFFFNRGTIYGEGDDARRFLYFSRAAIEFLYKSGTCPDVLHVHDWPVAILPALQEEMYLPLGFKRAKTILTLHNLEHQGKCSPDTLSQIGLRAEDFLVPTKLQDPKEPTLINLLKGGIVYADHITTVSPSYEKEIKEEPGGHGLASTLLKYEQKLQGILNGIDEDFWNPETDPHLFKPFLAHPPFSKEAWEQVLNAKAHDKKAVKDLLGLTESPAPLVACITRLVPQKAPLLILQAFRHLIASGAQCVILGSTYSQELEEMFQELQEEAALTAEGAVILKYDEALSHRLYAGADMLMVPSLFEPCGLTQLIALRYGTLPIARRTGGLQDTVVDVDDASLAWQQRNGFLFDEAEINSFTQSLDRALALFRKKPKKWQELMQHGMSSDFSWKAAAQEYLRLYRL